MNKIKSLLLGSMLVVTTLAFGQSNEKTVSKMAKGTTLTDADLGFLSMVTNAQLGSSRGAGGVKVSVNNVDYSVGHTLTKKEARSIGKAVKEFQKATPGEKDPKKGTESARGGLCYYWYYYCDGWGYCYWWKYWYYC